MYTYESLSDPYPEVEYENVHHFGDENSPSTELWRHTRDNIPEKRVGPM